MSMFVVIASEDLLGLSIANFYRQISFACRMKDLFCQQIVACIIY
jgi:hypothetical protein